MSVNGDEDERSFDDEDDDDTRSKKSLTVKSRLGMTARRRNRIESSVKLGDSVKRRASPLKTEVLPPQTKLTEEKHKYKDNLEESHFVELRQFLYKKQRQEAIS